jgi:aspartate aminotransferase-like enzyme
MNESDKGLTFKIATEDWELDKVQELNYRTFVEEIPQHTRNPTGRLVDKFHTENTYFICLDGEQLVGMVALRGKRPFSLDAKLPDLDTHLPPDRAPCEVRLLSVERGRRHSSVLAGLLNQLITNAIAQGYDCALISGTVRQQKLYRHLGFVPFGPMVGSDGAQFQPMYLLLEQFYDRASRFYASEAAAPAAFSFIPGPVAITAMIRRAFRESPVSHRSEAFMRRVQRVQHHLCRLAGAQHVEIMLGSGTLANDVVAGQLALLDGTGAVLANGEFGERLVDHARRMRLSFATHTIPWGEVFAADALERLLDSQPATQWLWAVHCETSTGVLNDLDLLKALCRRRSIRLCVDANSSFGNTPVDFAGLYLATGVSGKGLAAFPGLALVFRNHAVQPAPDRLPRYLDLGLYAAHDGVPFTHSSNLITALEAALFRYQKNPPFESLAASSAWLRQELRDMGFALVAPEAHAAPGIVSIALPRVQSAGRLGEELEARGYLLSYRSGYLLRRNWIQISLMGDCSRDQLERLLATLRQLAGQGGRPRSHP